ENLNKWQIPAKFRYPIALAFKIVGRSRTEETAIEMAKKYIEFINTLPTIEAVYSGKQTPLTFVERMYGIKFQSETIVSHEDLNKFESGL
ncbi:1364_t:CDS:2, partial [Rhizophagus irregularis]